MKVFISWSGPRSQYVASALHAFLPDIIQSLEPWMSSHDILAGARWSSEIGGRLHECNYGILCLTPENVHSDWLLFEAGALAKRLDEAYLVPYLIGLEPSDVPSGPLAQFQAKRADREDTWRIVEDINELLGETAVDAARLNRLFEKSWPDLAKALRSAPAPAASPAKGRTTEEILTEVLDTVRELSREAGRLKSATVALSPPPPTRNEDPDLLRLLLLQRSKRLAPALSEHPTIVRLDVFIGGLLLATSSAVVDLSGPVLAEPVTAVFDLPPQVLREMPIPDLADILADMIQNYVNSHTSEGGPVDGMPL